ncbi:MAG TPA: PQQ-binding-like beta-propeller repeat protein [Acidimicrobiales bacterium]|nr:PQQ-binding-like beta-propeller repeat protein [Acidimicrobiales bacterium]
MGIDRQTRPSHDDAEIAIIGGSGFHELLSDARSIRATAPVAILIAMSVIVRTFLAGTASAATSAAPWPMALHDAEHSGTSTSVGPQSGTISWQRDLGGNITPGPVVAADGTIYAASSLGVLHALNPKDGSDRWTFDGGAQYSGGTDLSTSPLILPSGTVLWPGPRDRLFALSPNGTKLWSHTFGAAVLSPVLAGSRVYVVLADATVWAIDVTGGTPALRWSIDVGSTSFGSPVVDPDGNVITTADDAVVAIADHGSTGSVRWRHTLDADVEVSASVDRSGSVYVESNHGSVYAFSPSGTLRWKLRIGQESYSSSSVSPSGLLYFGDNGGVLHVVRASTGGAVAADRAGKGIWSAQVIDARGDAYFGTQGKEIVGYDHAGHHLFTVPTSGAIDSYPGLTASGALIIGDERGTLYAIGGTSPR